MAPCGASGEAPAPLNLTPAEQSWLTAHPVLQVGADPAWPPFSFYSKEGVHSGVDADLLATLSDRLGVRFEVVRTRNWGETEALAAAGKLDLICGIAETPAREKSYFFTRQYFGAPVAVIMRDDAPFYTGLRNLRGREVAAPEGYVTTEMIERQHPTIRLRKTANAAEALRAVSRGQAVATVENLVTASHLLKAEGLTNLKIVGIAEFDFELRLAVPRDRLVLRDILDKALAAIPEEERFRLRDKWVPVNIEGAINWSVVQRLALWIFGTAALVVFVVVIKNRRLSRELAARRKAEAALRELHEEKNNLMGMLAHDLNNPLQTINLACDSLGDESNQEAVEIIRQTVERMSRLVKNVLNVNALESGRATLELRKIDLSEIVSEVVAVSKPRAATKGITLTFTPGEGKVFVDGDALAQIVDNLISNALKFTPANGNVEVTVGRTGDAMEVRVCDTGPGLMGEDLPLLFSKFTRLSAQPTAGETSHGLGLAIVKRLAESMGGTITAESVPGAGATFRLRFPEAK